MFRYLVGLISRRNVSSGLLGLTILAADGWSQNASLEAAGELVIEVEDFAHNHVGVGGASAQVWQSATIVGSSNGALQALPATESATGDTTVGPRLDYRVKFSTTGLYHFWVRLLGADEASNSVHVGLNGTPVSLGSYGVSTGSGAANTWIWSKTKDDSSIVTINVTTAGYATLNLWMRESGVAVDKILLTTNSSYVPAGTGPAESAHESGGNQFPAVALTAPVANSATTLPGTVSFTATASDPDSGGNIAKVEFFQGITKLGEDSSSPYDYSWSAQGSQAPGFYFLSARATDNLGASTISAPRPVRLLPGLPYVSSFETSEGFLVGDLNNQRGWEVSSGEAEIVTGGAQIGTQSITLIPGSVAAQIELEFGSNSTNPVFVDFWTKPLAGADTDSGTILDVDAARLAFVKTTTGTGRFFVLQGNGTGGGTWSAIPKDISIGSDDITQAWERITVRLNYSTKKWDFYHGTTLLAYDVPFRLNSATYFSWFALKGHVTAGVRFDAIYSGADNPMFSDSDRDGLDDAWELANGLPTNSDSRNLDTDNDGLTNLMEYFLGTQPQVTDSDGDGALDGEDPGPLDYNQVPNSVVTAPSDGTILTAPGSVTITATATDPDVGDTISKVEFYQNGQKLGESTVAPYSYTWSGMPAGIYAFTVKAFDNRGGRKMSAPAAVTVEGASGTLPVKYGLRLELDANTLALADGSSVASWTDLSGYAKHATQSTGTNQPIFITNVLNGRPVIRFDGSNDGLSMTGVMTGATSGDIFVVLKAVSENPSGEKKALSFGGVGLRYSYNSSGQVTDSFGSNSDNNLGDPQLPIAEWRLYNASATSGSWKARMDGVTIGSYTTNTVSFSSAAWLGRGSDGYNWAGDIAEVLVYDRILTDAERDAVGRYLGGKYALYTLPAVPTQLNAVAISGTQVSLSWTGESRADRVIYEVERRTSSTSYVKVGEGAGLAFVDANLSAFTDYTYRVRARSYSGTSGYSGEVSVTTLGAEAVKMPTSTGLRMWLRADSSQATGATSFIDDQSGNGKHATQADSGQRPQIVANQLNGRPVIRFDGSNDGVSMTGVMTGATSGDIFVVLKAASENPSGEKKALRFGGVGLRYSYNSSGQVTDSFGSNSDNNLGDPPLLIAEWRLYNASATFGSWKARMDGMIIGSYTTNTVSFASDAWLGRANDGFNWAGDIAEVLVYDRILSEAEREAVGRYLGGKYALYALPATPTQLDAVAISGTQVSLTWIGESRADRVIYEVERRTSSTSYVKVGEGAGLAFVDANLSAFTDYTYRVRARAYSGTSAYSGEVSVTTLEAAAVKMPTSAGLRMWLRADSTQATGTTSFIDDQSGNGKHATQLDNGQRPQIIANQLNGRPVVRFDGSNDGLSMTGVMTGATSGDIFVVLKAVSENPSGEKKALRFGGVGLRYAYNSNGQVTDSFGSTNNNDLGNPPLPIAEWRLYNASATSGSWKARMDGMGIVAYATNTVSFASDAWLGRANDGFNWAGDIAEVLVYDRILSEAEREAVGYYLVKKYGFSSPINFGYYRDTNFNGLTDIIDSRLGLDPYILDTDGDGFSNLYERRLGTNALLADSDGDGINDALDAFPLDHSRSVAPNGTPGDTTAPNITLTLPGDAILMP